MATHVHGLDRQSAPESAALARRMLDAIGGRWWNIYIGGPFFKGKGWSPAQVQDYVRHGIDRFMLTYMGRQAGGTLSRAQGLADGRDALAIAGRYGYGGNFPLCLDVEADTYPSAPGPTLEYVRAWCATVKAAGARPGLYSSPSTLAALHGKVAADFVWVASWISHHKVDEDPRAAPHMPADLWPAQGQRAWQYSAAFGPPHHVVPCTVLGLDVDINVADLECLAHAPGVQLAQRPAQVRALRRGDSGPGVERLTRRLAFVRSRASGKPYLDRARAHFDAETDSALKAFQREHHIKPRGIFGVATRHALGRAVELEKARRERLREQPIGHNGAATDGAGHTPVSFASLVADVRRLDAQTDRAWKLLVAYAARRRRALERAREEAVDLADIAKILLRMEHTLETLVDVEEKEVALLSEPAGTQTAVAAVHPEPGPGPMAAAATEGQPLPTATGTAVAESAPAGPPPQAPPHPAPRLEDLPDSELLHRVERHDRAVGASREVLIARYAEVERKIAQLTRSQAGRPRPNGGVAPPAPGAAKPSGPAGHVAAPKSVGARKLQRLLNQFSRRYLHGLVPLAEDGAIGPLTKKRIRAVKYYLGYGGKGRRSAKVDAALLRRIRRPGSPRYSNPAMLARARARRRKQKKVAVESGRPRAGVVVYDTKPVAAWMVPYLDWARAHGWHGVLASGFRTPAESEHLCIRLYGRPRVEGRCGGLTSNHFGIRKPAGAIDVTDYVRFAELMRRCPLQPKIKNDLPADRGHFSLTGH
jgi:peptidoglycan hydrolase-like protein with peptidoglycan-binding domain